MEPAMNGFSPVWIHHSLRAETLAEKRSQSLFEGMIDHGFHYLGTKQAQLWLEVHRRHAPTHPSFAEIYRAIAKETSENLAGQAVHVISLGPGGGEKESRLLQALHERGCRLRYTPVDASLELALLSAEVACPYVEGEILPVVGDLSLLAELPACLDRHSQDQARLFTIYGAVHNFLPSRIFPWLACALRPEDRLLMSANLASAEGLDGQAYRLACEAILPQYDNAETKAWLRQILVDWGIAQYLGEPIFQVQSIENILALVAGCHWNCDVDFDWEGRAFSARAGENLRLFFSLRYTPMLLKEKLESHGMALGPGHTCGHEGVWHVVRTS